jgi:molybdenum cofactor cytidylyltransferase
VKFGPVKPREALGAVAVHSVRTPERLVKKGTKVTDADVAALERAGIKEIVAARLEQGDVSEDAAAATLADKVAGEHVTVERAFTGRANIYAGRAGVLLIDRIAVDALNRIDESVTLATLPEYRPVQEGEMIATVKIIPFAISAEVNERALAAAKQAVSVAPYRVKRVAVISTELPGLAPKVIDKTVRVTAERLKPAGAEIVSDERVPHDAARLKTAIAKALKGAAEIVIVFGASAIADRRDVIPAAIVDAGGEIEHFGMPVDPGNLMLVGSVGATPVIGAPGCARSPKENGFDWLLARMLAGLKVQREDITGLGVGGLLMEIVTRPQPREDAIAADKPRKVAAILLAAGRGTRMGGPNKLLEEIRGKAIVRKAAEAAAASKANPVIVVTGHEAERVAASLKGLEALRIHNPDYAAGLSTSLKAGIQSLPQDADAAVVVLGDMPDVSAALIDKLVAALDPARGALIAVPTREGRRGNPVVWSRRFFEELAHIDGDTGARHLIAQHNEAVVEVPVEDEAAFHDIDTPEALRKAREDAKT